MRCVDLENNRIYYYPMGPGFSEPADYGTYYDQAELAEKAIRVSREPFHLSRMAIDEGTEGVGAPHKKTPEEIAANPNDAINEEIKDGMSADKAITSGLRDLSRFKRYV